MLKTAEKNVLYAIVATALVGMTGMKTSFSGETKKNIKQTMEETSSDAKRGVKKASRTIQDKSCELINGKMECAGKRVKHSIQNGVDNVEDAVD